MKSEARQRSAWVVRLIIVLLVIASSQVFWAGGYFEHVELKCYDKLVKYGGRNVTRDPPITIIAIDEYDLQLLEAQNQPYPLRDEQLAGYVGQLLKMK